MNGGYILYSVNIKWHCEAILQAFDLGPYYLQPRYLTFCLLSEDCYPTEWGKHGQRLCNTLDDIRARMRGQGDMRMCNALCFTDTMCPCEPLLTQKGPSHTRGFNSGPSGCEAAVLTSLALLKKSVTLEPGKEAVWRAMR